MKNEKVEEVVDSLEEKDDVRAVAVVGSYARNPGDDHNDIDLFVIVEGDWRKRETVQREGLVIEKFYNSLEMSRKYLEQDDWYTNYHWYMNADIRYDPEDLFEQLRNYAEERKEKALELDNDDRRWIRYGIWDLRQDIEGEDVGQKRYMLYKALDFVLENIYYIEGRVPVKDNYRIEKLKDFNGYLYKNVQDFLTSSSTIEKQRKIEKMFEYMERKIGEADPEYSSEREQI